VFYRKLVLGLIIYVFLGLVLGVLYMFLGFVCYRSVIYMFLGIGVLYMFLGCMSYSST